MNSSAKLKLFVMMALQFFIWGAWLPKQYGYLSVSMGFTAGQIGWVFNAFPIAAIVGMFFSNQFADRKFAAEKFLAFSHLVGGLALIGIAFIEPPQGLAPGDRNPAFAPFFGLMLVHCLFYVPTISITNSIAFTHMKDAQQEFGIVRMGGTIGWILAAWPFTFIFLDWDAAKAANPSGTVALVAEALKHPLAGAAAMAATKWTYIVAGVASLVLAAFSFALPHTPPKKAEEGAESLAWVGALRLLKHPFILVLWLVTLVDSAVHNSYFLWTESFLSRPVAEGGVGIASNLSMPVMSIGQIAEILTMAVLGLTLKRLGWKWTMTLGILGHAARFGVYAFFPHHKDLIILVQVLHGICYAFFFATVYIFVEEFFPKDARTSAQGLFNVMILGIGSLVAGLACPTLQGAMTANGVTNYKSLFLIPLGLALAAAILLAIFFNPPAKAAGSTDDPPKQPH